jgi:hypothetical protein
MISMGGKELLTEAVAQAIHLFVMTVFNILKNICKGITTYGGSRVLMCKSSWARFYLGSNILKTELKSGSSFTWPSIFYDVQNLKSGSIWRVGERDQINIYGKMHHC